MSNKETMNKIIEMLKEDEKNNRQETREYKMGIATLKEYYNYDYKIN